MSTEEKLADMMAEDMDIDNDDVQRVGQDMVIHEGLDIDTVNPEDYGREHILQDYHITRRSLQITLQQSHEIFKVAAELIKSDPSAFNLNTVPQMMNAMTNVSEHLFALHERIASVVKVEKDEKDKDGDQQVKTNIKNILDEI